MKRLDWKEFETILDGYDIKKLYHFTDRSNLASIIRNRGLLSWADCQNNNISIPNPGGDYLSRKIDKNKGLDYYVRLSFTNQHPMMFVCQKGGRVLNPIILEIDRSVIFDDTTKFSNMNTVKRSASVGSELIDFNKIHFRTVKRRCHFDVPFKEQKYFQAEVLVENYIPLEKIFNIASFGLPIPTDIQIKQHYGIDKYIFDRDAVGFMSECLWELNHTNYIQGVQLSDHIFQMFDVDNDLNIFIQGVLDRMGVFHLVVSKQHKYGICSITLEHFINILVSLNMFDEGIKRKFEILLNV